MGALDVPTEGMGGDPGYRVRVSGFEGPLDLLLHLVRVNEVDITDIPIVEITEQYNAYLVLMRDLNLEIAGEYLVMAATLMHIKSRMLLPPDPDVPPEEQEDPRTELQHQLLEYQRFKQAAENLQALDSVRSLIWTRDGMVPEEFSGEELLVVDLFDLISAFRKLLGRVDDETRLRLRRDEVSVSDRIAWLTERLESGGAADLLELFHEMDGRTVRIATFLAVLEMVRLRLVVAFQKRGLESIWISLREEAGSPVDRDPSSDDASIVPDGIS